MGIDVRRKTYANDIQTACMRQGLIVTTQGSRVLLLPSLTIDRTVAAKGLDILAAATRRLHKRRLKRGDAGRPGP